MELQRGVLMDRPIPHIYLTVKETADRWKRTTRTIRQYIADNKINAVQFTERGPHLIPLDEIERFERENKQIKN